jgi:two-component system sensor histidine kinase/response regulator
LEILKVILTSLKEWLGLLAPFGVVFGFIWQFWLKKRLTEMKDLFKTIKIISEEFRPNGGSTLRDAINRIEYRLSVEQQKTMAIIKSMPLGTWLSDRDGKYVDVNRSMCRIMGRTESEILGDNWSNWLHIDDKERVWEEWERSVASKLSFEMTYRFIRPDGKVQRVHAVAYQLRDDRGDLVGFLGTLYAVGEVEN